ncbi:hypothetical protein AWB64_06023 [Caballeronia sordidicola]|uniref:Uncharacterized protein n=1 Tax=Caballeronia sordidicola TaxID=196367 RepID=A0A158IDL8_CABSO|nr:hypothetical protein AWB64_06023 [Caballeronia sordidicola]
MELTKTSNRVIGTLKYRDRTYTGPIIRSPGRFPAQWPDLGIANYREMTDGLIQKGRRQTRVRHHQQSGPALSQPSTAANREPRIKAS